MTVLTFDEIVLAIRGSHPEIPLAMAERAARRELGIPESSAVHPDFARTEAVNAQLLEDALEDAHVDAGDKLVRALGGHVVRNSQKRASKVTPGVPDRRYYFPRHRLAFWWEAKRVGGKQSSAQKLFEELCEACADGYIAGPLMILEDMLILMGIGRKEPDGTWPRCRFTHSSRTAHERADWRDSPMGFAQRRAAEIRRVDQAADARRERRRVG